MKLYSFLLTGLFLITGLAGAVAQCDVKNRLNPDGSMYYFY